MDFKELAIKYGVSEEKMEDLLGEMKSNKMFLTAEENMDVRYSKLKEEHESNNSKLSEANALIEELQKASKGNESMSNQINEYKAKVEQMEAENQQLKLENATKVALLEAGGEDIDYLMYKLKSGNELKLNKDGVVDGLTGLIDEMKTSMPNQFKSSFTKKIEENKLDMKNKEQGETITKEQFDKMTYQERNNLYKENKEAYDELTKA